MPGGIVDGGCGLPWSTALPYVDGPLGKPILVHLELYPADPHFRQRRPELAYLWKKDRLRLQLGFNAHQLPQLDAALRYFEPGRYLGIQQTQATRRFR